MPRSRRPGRSTRVEDEPQPDWGDVSPYSSEDDLVAVDFTSGGAPFGLTVGEWRDAQATGARAAGWARARRAIDGALRGVAASGAVVEVGWVSHVGRGLSRDAYAAEVMIGPDPGALSGCWVALVPREADCGEGGDPITETRVLAWLGGRALPFRVPRALVAAEGAGARPLLVREFVAGVSLDPRAGRQAGLRPWEVVGHLAAAVHAVEPPDWLPGFSTRRDHAVEALRCLDDATDPVCVDARAWAMENLPDALPPVLLHGDLLGQNILISPTEPPALIDWEYALRGDPAFDLAIVTRGVRRPFQLEGGLSRLVNAYVRHGGQDVSAAHVHVQEIALVGSWYRQSLAEGSRTGSGPGEYLACLRGILRRAVGAG